MATFNGTTGSDTITPELTTVVGSEPGPPGDGADIIIGDNGADNLAGGGGNDTLYGHRMNSDDDDDADTMHGNAGNDTFYVSTGGDQVYGDEDDDTLIVDVAIGAALLDGGTGSDTLRLLSGNITGATLVGIELTELEGGTSANNRMAASQLGSLGSLTGFNGAQTVEVQLTDGGTAAASVSTIGLTDLAIFSSDEAESFALASNDLARLLYNGGVGVGTVTGGAAGDVLEGDDGADVLRGGAGGDVIYGHYQFGNNDGATADQLFGDAGADTIHVSTGGDRVYGGTENDLIIVKVATGAGVLAGDAGADTLQLHGSNISGATVTGIERTELSGSNTTDMTAGQLDNLGTIAGLSGARSAEVDLTGGGSATGVRSSLARLELHGSNGTETIKFVSTTATAITYEGGSGKGIVSTGKGADTLEGEGGADTLSSGAGNDELNGGLGRDSLIGGTGRDSFVFDARLATANADRITGFVARDDTIEIDNAVASSLRGGRLASSAFKDISKGDVDSSDRILYDGDSGALYFDRDGSGQSARVLIATLVNDPSLTAADILVV